MTKMTKILVLAGVAAIALAIATPADAACTSPKAAGSFNTNNQTYAYWYAPVPSATQSPVTLFWQVGAQAGNNQGTCAGSTYFSGSTMYFFQQLGDGCVTGCPSTRMAVVAEVASDDGTEASFIAQTIDETPDPAVDFQFYNNGNVTGILIPRPAVTSSSRAGSVVTVNITMPNVTSGGAYGPQNIVTGVELVQAVGTGDPGRLASSYPTSLGTAASYTGLALTCASTANDIFLGTRVLFADGQKSQLVGQATRINCNPALADPGRFKIIDKQKNKKGEDIGPR